MQRHRYPLRETPSAQIFNTLFAHIDAFLAEYKDAFTLTGIGVGLKGIIAMDQRTIVSSSVLTGLLPFDLCGVLTQRYGVLCRIDNDVHAATMAELHFGDKYRDFLFLNIGTGMAVGMVSNGHLIRGAHNGAGEIGICLYARPDTIGERFLLEDLVSGRGLQLEALRLKKVFPESLFAKMFDISPESISGHDVLAAFRRKDELALAVVDRFLDSLCFTLINLCLLLDPCVVILGGGVIGDGFLFSGIQERLNLLHQQFLVRREVKIALSTLGSDDIGVLGAASLVLVTE